MLKRRARLSRAGISTALTKGRRTSSAHLTVVRVPGQAGVAVIVSKKTARRSVDRHRIKRRISAALKGISFLGGVVIFPRAASLSLPLDQLHAELASLLS